MIPRQWEYRTARIEGETKGLIFDESGSVYMVNQVITQQLMENYDDSVIIGRNKGEENYYVMTPNSIQQAFEADAKEYQVSQDGNLIYYIKEQDSNQDGLFQYHIKKQQTKRIAVAEEFENLCVSPNGDCVICTQKGTDGNICSVLFYKNQPEILGENIEVLCVSNKAQCIYYINGENVLCCRYQGKEKELEDAPKVVRNLMINYDHTEMIFYRNKAMRYTKNGCKPIPIVQGNYPQLMLNTYFRKPIAKGLVYYVSSFKNKAMVAGNQLIYFNGTNESDVICQGGRHSLISKDGSMLLAIDEENKEVSVVENYRDQGKRQIIEWERYCDEHFKNSNSIDAIVEHWNVCDFDNNLLIRNRNWSTNHELYCLDYHNGGYYHLEVENHTLSCIKNGAETLLMENVSAYSTIQEIAGNLYLFQKKNEQTEIYLLRNQAVEHKITVESM